MILNNHQQRKGCKDVFNAFMVKEATFNKNDIPLCPMTASSIPSSLITFSQAKSIHHKEINKNPNYACDSFVCFYEDDQNFDGKREGIYAHPKRAYEILRHFKGIITPDFSTYQDFPLPLKLYNTYRMRAFGYWYGTVCKKQVINNVRWGTEESFPYCFDGIEENSILAIGTVGGSPRKLVDRKRFEKGLFEMVKRLKPWCIVIYGSARYPCFDTLKKSGIRIIQFDSRTASYFKRRMAR